MTTWENTHPSEFVLVMLYLAVIIGVGGLTRFFMKNVSGKYFRVPYGAGLLVIGAILGIFTLSSPTLRKVTVFPFRCSSFDLAAIVFPPFVFKTAYQMDVHIFHKSFSQILIVSTVGFAFCCISIGFFMSYTTWKEWPVSNAVLLGLLASVIDVKDNFKFLGQVKNFGVLMAGEELITASLAMFLFHALVHFDDGPLKTNAASNTMYKIFVPIVAGLIIGKLYIHFVSWDRCDLYTNIFVSIFVSYSMIYTMEIYLGTSGILALVVFGLIVCTNKGQIASELEQSLTQFWQLLYDLFNFILYIESGIFFVHASQSHGERADVVRIVMLYLLCLITRALIFVFLSPILTRIGYGFNWKNGLVLIWGALKGTTTLLLAQCIYLDSHLLGEFSHKAMIYGTGIVLMNLIVNGVSLMKMVKLLGFMTISVIKVSNMNSIISYVMSARDRSINMLKMNRFFGDASWDMVRNATKLVHPYKDSFKEERELSVGEEKDSHFLTCPECKKDIPLVPTHRELQEIRKEAHMRILKAKKVSYWRQFEWGMMTKEANRTLVGAVDDALEKNKTTIDMDSLRNTWKPKGCTVYLRNTLVKLMAKEGPTLQIKAPLRQWQLFFYKIVSSIWWEYAIFLLVILHTISIILDFVCRPHFETVRELSLICIGSVCFGLLLLQELLTVLGLGCYNFIRFFWSFIDMVTLVASFFYIFYAFKNFIDTKNTVSYTILLSLSTLRAFYVLRFFRICYVARASIPKVVEYLDRKIDVQLAYGFDVGKGFVTGESEVLKLLPRFVGEKNIMMEIKTKMEADRLAITKEIGILQRNRPTIAITMKTREAMAAVLHVMKQATKELKDGGLVDDEEYRLMYRAIEHRQKYIRKRFLSISPCPPDVLLRQVSWLIDDEDVASFLITHSLMVNLNYEEILIRADEEPQGIYVIVSGLVRMTYVPNLKKLERLEKSGALPNVDYPIGVNYRESQEDYIVSGNVMGEIGILTGRTYDATITCESSVQAYFVSIDVINYAMKSQTEGTLEQRIWKTVGVRLACLILPGVPAYQSWTQEKIHIHLERAFVPRITAEKPFIMSDIMEAVLLIEGRALDAINKDVYFAPSYIPRTVRKLVFANRGSDKESQPILLIVPAEEIDEQELMDYIEGYNDLTPSGSTTSIYKKAKKRSRMSILGMKKMYGSGVKAIKADTELMSDLESAEDGLGFAVESGLHPRYNKATKRSKQNAEVTFNEEDYWKEMSDEFTEFKEEIDDSEESDLDESERHSGQSTVPKRSRKEKNVMEEFEKDEEDGMESSAPAELSGYRESYFNYKPLFDMVWKEESIDFSQIVEKPRIEGKRTYQSIRMKKSKETKPNEGYGKAERDGMDKEDPGPSSANAEDDAKFSTPKDRVD